MELGAAYPQIQPIGWFSEPVSSVTHLLAAPAALWIGLRLLWRTRGDLGRGIAVGVFVFAATVLLAASGVYHLLDPGTAARAVLRRIDHAAIWIMVAATFVPIHLLVFRRPFWRWGVLGVVWTAALTGLVLKTVFFHQIPESVTLAFYLGVGWLGLVSGLRLLHVRQGRDLALVVSGGIAYTAGAVLEFIRWPVLLPGYVGPHELFHLAVIAGLLLHGTFIRREVLAHAALPSSGPDEEATPTLASG